LATYERAFAEAIAQIKTSQIHLVGLGCGGGQKDAQLLSQLQARRKKVFYTPSDVSTAMVLVARAAALKLLPAKNIFPFVCDLATAEDLPTELFSRRPQSATRLVTFFGMIPNFEPRQILPKLTELLRPNDFLLFSANLAPGDDYAAGIDEARTLGVAFQVHAVSDLSMVAAVRLGARKLVHSVNINWVTKAQAQEVAAAGAQVASITGFGSPNFDVFSHDNQPKFRDGKPWPSGIIDSQGEGQEAGYMPVNLRTLYDNGVEVSYATDTTFDARGALAHELKTLNLVFTPADLVKIMGPNSAKFVDREKDIGTVEPGKLGDLVVLAGNPFDGYWNLMTAVVTIKGGVIVMDKRGQPNAGKPDVSHGY
jgi:SAM-dependent methyltransferase